MDQQSCRFPNPVEGLVTCKLCNGCGAFKGYVCVRCGGYTSFVDLGNTLNPEEITDEEMGRWAALRLTEEPVAIKVDMSFGQMPLPVIHKDFSFNAKQLKYGALSVNDQRGLIGNVTA